jgi:hypothetical protein
LLRLRGVCIRMGLIEVYREIRIESIKERLDAGVDTAVNEDWGSITDHRYPKQVRDNLRNLLRCAEKYDIPTEKYRTQLNDSGINL